MNFPSKIRLRQWPDQILKEQCRCITSEEVDQIDKLFREMERVLFMYDGHGLAAPQIGMTVQALVMLQPNDQTIRLVNPILSKVEGDPVKTKEGCLSLPGVVAHLHCRYPKVIVTAYDDKGEVISAPFTGYAANVFQHEYDHLLGKTLLDRVGKTQQRMAIKKMRKFR